MSAVVEAREPSARYLEASESPSTSLTDLLATAPGGVARLREFIRSLAVRGELLSGGRRSGSADMPPNWTRKRLADLVASSEAGWSPSCPEQSRRSGRWGVLKVSAVSWGTFDPLANKELPAELLPRPQYEVRHGDFLLSRANTAELVAKSVVVRNPPPLLMLSDKIIRLKLREGVDPDYINLVNNSAAARSYYASRASGTSTTMKNVSRDVVLDLSVPLPPLAEQSRIVARVDELMRLCDAVEAKGRLEAEQHARLLDTLLGTLTDSTTPEELATNWQRVAAHFDLLLDRPDAVDALEQTILQLAVRGLLGESPTRHSRLDCPESPTSNNSFADELPFGVPEGWRWVKFGSVAMIERGGSPRPIQAFLTTEPNGLNWIKIGDTQKGGKYITRTTEKIRPEGLTKTRKVYPGDFLLTNSMSFGRPYITLIEGCIHDGWLRISPQHSVNKDFLYLLLSSSFVREMFEQAAAGGVVLNLNADKVRNMPIPLPPAEAQAAIAAHVDNLMSLCATLRQRLAAQQTVQAHIADALVEQALA